MGQNKWVKRDRSKETGPKGQIQIDGSKKTGPRRHNGPNISKLVQYGLKSNKKVSKWVRHNQVSWSSFSFISILVSALLQPSSLSKNSRLHNIIGRLWIIVVCPESSSGTLEIASNLAFQMGLCQCERCL